MALFAALIATGSVVALADTYDGKRTNNLPANGYNISFLSLIPDDDGVVSDYSPIFEYALNAWRGLASTNVDFGLREIPNPNGITPLDRTVSTLAVDYYGGNGVLGLTSPFFKPPTGVAQPIPALVGNALNWSKTETILYHGTIKDTAKDWSETNPATFDRIAKHVAVHEIGHSLKLAHPPGGPLLENGGNYIGDGVEHRSVPSGQKSVMTWQITYHKGDPADASNVPATPQPYDIPDLTNKWGRRQ